MYSHTYNSSCTQSCDSVSECQQYYLNVLSYFSDLDTMNHDTIMLGGHGNMSSSNGSGCTSSSCVGSGSPTSPLSCCSSNHPLNSSSPLFQRSFSSPSLQLQTNNANFTHVSSPPPALSHDLDNATQGLNNILNHHYHHYHHHHHHQEGSSLTSKESTSSIIEGMSKACRYSPQEKKERIARYRNKRTQRNFTKKIQYECRKTLADSRLRIRGRFARNDEIECSYYYSNVQQNEIAEEDDDNNNDEVQDGQQWIRLLDYISSNLAP